MANATLTPLPLAALGPWCPPPYSARLNATAGGSYDPDGGRLVRYEWGAEFTAPGADGVPASLPAAFNRHLTAPFDAAPAFFPVDAAGLGAEVEVCGPLSRGRYNFTLSVVDEQGGVSATALVGSLLIGADGYPTGLLPALPPNASAPDAEPECGASTMALSAGEAHVTGAQPAAAVRDDSDICSASSSAKLGAPMKVKPLPLPSKPSMRKARVVEEPHSGAASGALALVGSAGSSPVG